MEQRITSQFNEHLDVVIRTIEPLTPLIEEAGLLAVQTLLTDKKILICASDRLAPLASFFSTQLIDRYLQERPGFPAINLNADSSVVNAISADSLYNSLFAKQIRALGQSGDLLIVFSGGKSTPIVQAIRAANEREMSVIAITGGDNSDIRALLEIGSIEMRVPDHHPARVAEVQLLLLNQLCDIIELQIFGSPENYSE